MRVSEAIVGRQSIRAFLPDKPVSDEQIQSLLSVAGRAPSGSNIQPWHVYVVRGETKARITDAHGLTQAHCLDSQVWALPP